MIKRRIVPVLILLLMTCAVGLRAQDSPPHVIARGVWFLTGDTNGYSNTVMIEMRDYLIVVDANYPGRAKELLTIAKQLSPKPVRYVFDTHAHGDHAYGNSVWTAAGATTLAFQGVTDEMNRWEPTRWRNAMASRADVKATGETDVQRPQMSIAGDKLTLNDGTREVDFLFLRMGAHAGRWLCVAARGEDSCDRRCGGERAAQQAAGRVHCELAEGLDKAIALGPEHVLPGHGDAGGMEILQGQRQFLIDLYAAVKAQADAGKKPAEMQIVLPAPDNVWFPVGRAEPAPAGH